VLLKAMAKDPAARYQSAEEMLQTLERFPKMLEQRRRKARVDAKKSIDRLEVLVTENLELIGDSSPEYAALRQSIPSISSNRSGDDTIRAQNTETGLIEVLDIRDRANREYQRLALLLHKRREAVTLLREAASAEVEGQLEKALELVEKVAADVPESADAELFSKRIRQIVSDREKEQALTAIANLELLISENPDCLESQEHLNPADLKASLLSSPEPVRAPDTDATVLMQSPKSDSEIIRIRDKANAELSRLVEVIAQQREIQKRLDEEKKLRLAQMLQESQELHNRKSFQESLTRLDELLALDPQNVQAQALRHQVTTDIEDEKRRQELIQKAAALLQTASAQYSARKLDDAHKSLVNALALNPQYPEAAKLLAEVEQAEEQARLEEKKRNAEAAVTHSRHALQEGDLEKARHELERARDFDPDSTMVKAVVRDIAQTEENIKKLLQEGLSLLQAGDEDNAAARTEAIFTLDRQSSAGRELKEKIAETRARRERAEREKKERITRTLAQARDAEAARRLQNARELAATVLKEEPAHPEAQAILKRIQEIEAREALERRAQELLSAADQLAKGEDFQGAISLIQKADPAVTSLESVNQSLQKYQQARAQQEAREKAEREKRERIAGTLSEARKTQASGELDKALTLARSAIAEDPAHKEARELLKNVEEAIEARRQREETEKKARELLAQAETLAAKGKYQEALAGLQKADSRVSSLPRIKQRIEEYQKQAKAQEEAKERARRVQKHLEAGKNLFAQGDFAGCEGEIDQLLALEPGHSGALDLRTQARAQIQKQREERERARQLAEAIRAIEQNLNSGQLDAARQSVSRAQAIDANNGVVVRLQAQIAQREAELREQQLKKERLQRLLEEARGALERQDPDRAGTLLAEAVTLGAKPAETAALKKRIDKLQRSQEKQRKAAAVPAGKPSQRSLAIPVGIGLAVLVAIGLSIWAMRSPAYQQQITAAQSFLQQNDFSKAIETLQQVPQSSSLYGQAQTLLTQARNGEKKKNIDSLVAEVTGSRKAGENDKTLAAIEKLLALDPSNATAKRIGDDIRDEKYAKATKDEQDQIVNDAQAKAEELFKAGNLEGAMQKVDEVTKNRPDNPAATNLKRRITSQMEAANKASAERTKADQAKANALSAKAPELAAASFKKAEEMEQTAVRQQRNGQFDRAAKNFSETTRLYGVAEGDARTATSAANAQAAQRNQQLKSQAETARGEYETNRNRARDAGAETKAPGIFQSGARSASDAQAKYDRGDFTNSRTDFETASTQMRQALADATKPAQPAPPPAAPPAPAPAQNPATQTAAAPTNPAQKAAAQRAEDERAIKTVIDRYKTEYEAKNLNGIRAVFPGITGKEADATANFMGNARTIQLQIAVTEIQLSGDTATAPAQLQISGVSKENQRFPPVQTRVQFRLRRTNGGWSIQGIDR
jgi:tetratricopeptide (TPR) repeat protein